MIGEEDYTGHRGGICGWRHDVAITERSTEFSRDKDSRKKQDLKEPGGESESLSCSAARGTVPDCAFILRLFLASFTPKKSACVAQRNTGNAVKLLPGRSRVSSGPSSKHAVDNLALAVLANPLNEDH